MLQAPLVHLDQQDQLGQLVQQEPPARQDQLVPPDSLVRRVPREHRVVLVKLVLQAPLDHRVQQVYRAHKEPKDRQV